VVDAQDYGNYDYTLKADAGRFECGTYNVPGLLGFKASLELIRSVGVEAISHRVKHLTDHLAERLTAKGYQVVSPRTENAWSGIVSFTSPTHNHEQIVLRLRKEHHTEIALREGRLRCSPHFFNTEAQIERFVELLPGH
jgi:cysteine desulfurase / selenocysteine lyase